MIIRFNYGIVYIESEVGIMFRVWYFDEKTNRYRSHDFVADSPRNAYVRFICMFPELEPFFSHVDDLE